MWSAVESVSGGPCARGKHAAALVDGWLYVVGGRGAGGSVPLRDVWRYCLASGTWERLQCSGSAPPSLQEHSCTPHQRRLYVFGGEPGALGTETPLWVLDTQTLVWRKLSGSGAAGVAGRGVGSGAVRGRRGHSAHALNDCLLVYGGYKDLRGSTNELWAFHYERETWQQVRTVSAGPARHRHAAALHDARLYVHGGQCDLRECADLWYYDTMSRTWTPVRTPGRLSPSARSGHAGLRAGPHFYIFGGEAQGHPTNELWRLHFATETWERVAQSMKWPSPRVDCCALLVPSAPRRVRTAPAERLAPGPRAAAPARPEPPASLLREISKLSGFHMRRAARCSYSVLAGERDSTESLVRADPALAKSHSAYVIDDREREPADGGESPAEADVAEPYRDMSREPISVPDFADMVLPIPVLSPAEVTKLVYLDSESEEDARRETEAASRRRRGARCAALPKSASVRFTSDHVVVLRTEEEEDATSDYASAERVHRLSGFSNPHYLGPDVRSLGAALTPDSGAGDMELQELGSARAVRGARGEQQLHLLVVGGKEPPHVALLQSPLSMWSYRLL